MLVFSRKPGDLRPPPSLLAAASAPRAMSPPPVSSSPQPGGRSPSPKPDGGAEEDLKARIEACRAARRAMLYAHDPVVVHMVGDERRVIDPKERQVP